MPHYNKDPKRDHNFDNLYPSNLLFRLLELSGKRRRATLQPGSHDDSGGDPGALGELSGRAGALSFGAERLQKRALHLYLYTLQLMI